MRYELHHGDCLDVLKTLADCSVDAIVTDPPYGLGKAPDPVKVMTAWATQGYFEVQGKGFMGKKWDAFVPPPIVWKEVFRVLKPGGHLLAFAGTRTQDWMAMSLRFAGFEIRDMIFWCYGQGFPKSLDVSKAIDKAAGAEREVIGTRTSAFGDAETSDTGDGRNLWCKPATKEVPLTGEPATDAARQWEGWGTALKPALEPITLARKPLKTSCVNVLAVVESSLRNQGVKGDIKWKKENASGAGKKKLKASLDSTRHLEPSAVYAKSAGETETGSEERQTRKSLEKPMPIGEQKTGSTTGVTQNPSAKNCEIKSYPLTVESANAAERPNQFSLQSTISTAEGPSTGNLFTEKFTSNSKETDTLRDTESFVGIATGLTGSMASVRIVRDLEGRFLWPSGLPEFVPGSQLTVAANVLEHGTGGLNIDACRVEANGDKLGGGRISTTTEGWDRPWKHDSEAIEACKARGDEAVAKAEQLGRFPANFLHDGSEEVLALFPDSKGQQGDVRGSEPSKTGDANCYGEFGRVPFSSRNDTGSAARFFYCAKASKKDRDEGCDNMLLKACGMMEDDNYPIKTGSGNLCETKRKNVHPTVKPTDLMRYLCRLVTPPGGLILDPFMGSGSTGKAAMLEGFRFIGIEQEAEYLEIAEARIAHVVGKTSGMLPFE
jgi:DNA modification methylase